MWLETAERVKIIYLVKNVFLTGARVSQAIINADGKKELAGHVCLSYSAQHLSK